MAFEITWEDRIACKRMWGSVSAEEFLRSIAAMQSDPRYDRLRYSINDFLEAQALQFSESDIHHYAAAGIGAAISNPRLRIVIVATDPKILGLIRVYSKLSGYSVDYFKTMLAARAWITANEAQSPA